MEKIESSGTNNEVHEDNGQQNVDAKWSVLDWLKKIFSDSDDRYIKYGENGKKIIKLKHLLYDENLKEKLNNFISLQTNNIEYVYVEDKPLPWTDQEQELDRAVKKTLKNIKKKQKIKIEDVLNELVNHLREVPEKTKAFVSKDLNEEKNDDGGLYGILNNKKLPTASDAIVALMSGGIKLMLTNDNTAKASISFALRTLFSFSPELNNYKYILSFNADNPIDDGYEIFLENTTDIIINTVNILLNLPDIISHPKDVKVSMSNVLEIFNTHSKMENDLIDIKKQCIKEMSEIIKNVSFDDTNDVRMSDLEAEMTAQRFIDRICNCKANGLFTNDKKTDFYEFISRAIFEMYKRDLDRYKEKTFCGELLSNIRKNIGYDKNSECSNEKARTNIDRINKVYDDFCKRARDVYVDGIKKISSALKELNNDVDKSIKDIHIVDDDVWQENNILVEKKSIGRSFADCCIAQTINCGGCLCNAYFECAELASNIKANFSTTDIEERQNVISE